MGKNALEGREEVFWTSPARPQTGGLRPGTWNHWRNLDRGVSRLEAIRILHMEGGVARQGKKHGNTMENEGTGPQRLDGGPALEIEA